MKERGNDGITKILYNPNLNLCQLARMNPWFSYPVLLLTFIMPPAAVAKPAPRKRVRKRKRRAASSDSSSSSSSSDSGDETTPPEPAPQHTKKAPTPSEHDFSDSDSSSSSSSSSSSEDEEDVRPSQRSTKPTASEPFQKPTRKFSPSPSPPPTEIPSFLPTASVEEKAKKEQEMKARFRKFWLTSVADGFKDDLEEIRKVGSIFVNGLGMA